MESHSKGKANDYTPRRYEAQTFSKNSSPHDDLIGSKYFINNSLIQVRIDISL